MANDWGRSVKERGRYIVHRLRLYKKPMIRRNIVKLSLTYSESRTEQHCHVLLAEKLKPEFDVKTTLTLYTFLRGDITLIYCQRIHVVNF